MGAILAAEVNELPTLYLQLSARGTTIARRTYCTLRMKVRIRINFPLAMERLIPFSPVAPHVDAAQNLALVA